MPRRRLPRRRILTALAFAALLTIALAWLAMFLPRGNAWFGPRTTEELGISAADDGKLWSLSRGRNPWHTTVSYWCMQVSGMGISIPGPDDEARKFDFRQLPRHQRPHSLDDLYMNAWYHQTGWPLPALACSVHWKQQVRNSDIIYTVRGGVQLPRDPRFNPRALPLTPLWPGLLANLAIYATVWFLLTSALTTLRAHRRAKFGLCRSCGYSRAGLTLNAACPECGQVQHVSHNAKSPP